MHTHISTHLLVCQSFYMLVCACMHVYMYMYVYICVCMCMYVCMYVCMYLFICLFIVNYLFTNTCIYIYCPPRFERNNFRW